MRNEKKKINDAKRLPHGKKITAHLNYQSSNLKYAQRLCILYTYLNLYLPSSHFLLEWMCVNVPKSRLLVSQ